MSTKEFVFSIVDNLKQLFTGNVGIDQMMGPVGISEVVSKTNGIKEFLYMMALISISLGVTNLLPIPALDGGHLLFLLIEKVQGKPVDEEIANKIMTVFFALLIALLVFVLFNDIYVLVKPLFVH